MKETERPTKVTLEDLLQLKRAERPPAEFWPEFEQELRAKQLAAIVQMRPWWRTWVSRKSLVRLCMPLGAAAVVAMTFSSIRGFGPHAVSSGPVTSRATTDTVALNASTADVKDVAVVSREKSETNPVAAVNMTSVLDTKSGPADPAPIQAIEVAATTNEGAAHIVTRAFAPTPLMQVLTEPTLMQMVGRAISVSSQTVAPRTPITEPLAQVATPRDNRRARLLAYSVTFDPHAADSSDAVRSRDRITHRLSDEAIYDSITRLGLNADRVSIKF